MVELLPMAEQAMETGPEKSDSAISYFRQHLRRTIRLAGLSFLAVSLGNASAFILPVLPIWPSLRLPFQLAWSAMVMQFPLALLVGLSVVPLVMVCAPFSRRARLEVLPSIIVGASALFGLLTIIPMVQLRHDGLVRIAEQASPVISSLEDYRETHGHYPRELVELVPEYLDSVPSTGAILYQDFIYERRPDEESYEICVFTPVGVLNFDCFFYWPEGDYPESVGGDNPVERIGDWAYVHE